MDKNDLKITGIVIGSIGGLFALGKTFPHILRNRKYDKDGYDNEGYDRHGYDSDGFDRSGRDAHGYDRQGYDKDGYNSRGLDADGYRRNGFDLDGFNRDGYDRLGYGRDRYNSSGLDRANHTRDYYSDLIARLRKRLYEAHQQLRQESFRYAVQDARLVMEETIRALVQHEQGSNDSDDSTLNNLKLCEKKGLIDADTLSRLHDIRRIGNENGHELDAENYMTYNKVHFVIKQVQALLDFAEEKLVNPL